LKGLGGAAARVSLAAALACAATAPAEAASASATGEPPPALRSEPVIPSANVRDAGPAIATAAAVPTPAASSPSAPGTLPAGGPPRARVPAIDPATEQLTATIAGLREDVKHLQNESARSEAANQRLAELNGQLRQEVESLALELQAARAGARQRWLLYGAGLLLLGVLTGVVIKARPRRSAWS
jgi:hypothetical protein